MKSRKVQIVIMVIIMILFIILIRNNVVAKKEPPINQDFSDSSLALEISSEVVQDVYKKLNLIDDSIKSSKYRDMYFNFDNEKTLSIEEKLYSIIENIYQNKTHQIEEENGTYKLKLKQEDILSEGNIIYGETLDFTDIDYEVDRNCGVVGLTYLNEEYDIQIKECNNKKNLTKTKILSAVKDGDYIYIRIKAFRAYTTKNKIDENKKIYYIKNFNNNNLILKSSYNEIMGNVDKIFDDYDIDEYLFVFELKGDGYFLNNIIRKRD